MASAADEVFVKHNVELVLGPSLVDSAVMLFLGLNQSELYGHIDPTSYVMSNV